MKKLLLLLTLLLPVVATASTEELFGTWGTVVLSGNIANSKALYYAEGSARATDNPKSIHDPGFDIHGLVGRVGLGYQLTDNNKVIFGYAYQYGEPPYGKTQLNEQRAWQQHEYKLNLAESDTLTFRSRLEERTVDISDDTSVRFREQAKLTHNLNKKWSLIASEEFFTNVNKTNWGPVSGFDQNRGFVGVGYKFNDNYRTEIGYLNQYMNRENNYDRMAHILSVSLYGDVFK
jgi:hypothetical protein